jgi:4-hydroxybenzoate polyprenyltransferase/phosphoserine phosphatase
MPSHTDTPSTTQSYPLVVDLDGTLIRTDTLYESVLRAVRAKPAVLFVLPFWLAQGKAVLKQKLARLTPFDPTTLPYHHELLDWLHAQRSRGRRVVLCTATDHALATAIARHLNLFDGVWASDGQTNLAGPHKATELERRYGPAGFDYVGNAPADLAVWQRARVGIVVNASDDLVTRARACCAIERTFPPAAVPLSEWGRLLRVHQWVKNVLLCVPLVAAHQLARLDAVAALALGMLAFSLCASSVYLINDLLDLDSDRQHPRKRHRPLASGTIPAWVGMVLAPLLAISSVICAIQVGNRFALWLLMYLALTSAYSWGLKRVVLVDCLTLAALYTIRVIAGASAVHVALSFWLLACSIFLFFSLAFLKRYTEVLVQQKSGRESVPGRGYVTADAALLQLLGVTSGYASVLVLALYLHSDTAVQLYRTPEVLWGAVPLALLWVSWLWLQAHRGNMHDDPLVFAVRDPWSWGIGVTGLAIGMAATV